MAVLCACILFDAVFHVINIKNTNGILECFPTIIQRYLVLFREFVIFYPALLKLSCIQLRCNMTQVY